MAIFQTLVIQVHVSKYVTSFERMLSPDKNFEVNISISELQFKYLFIFS